MEARTCTGRCGLAAPSEKLFSYFIDVCNTHLRPGAETRRRGAPRVYSASSVRRLTCECITTNGIGPGGGKRVSGHSATAVSRHENDGRPASVCGLFSRPAILGSAMPMHAACAQTFFSLTLHPLSAGAAGKLASVPHERPVSSRRTLVRVSGGHLSNPRPDSGAPDNSRYRIPV